MGGYGKSRLSRQLLADLLPHYTHGVYIVELEPLKSAGEIASATARALRFSFFDNRSPEEQLVSFLRNKRMLICFDNFEHVLDGRELVEAILKGAPEVQVLATTREPLRLKGEQVYNLDALPIGSAPVPGGESTSNRTEVGAPIKSSASDNSDAMLLFADRARQVSPSFALTAENSAAVSAICRALSGIPLAIELAAAWTDSFTVTELHRELTHQLELEARFADMPGRHRSLRASLDWSWSLLTEEQRETLMRMATFKGGAFAEATEAVLGFSGMKLRKALAALMDKSWLSTRGSAAASAAGWVGKTQALGRTRWFMRDAASREYAFEKLEDTKVEDDSLYEIAVMSHARYFSRWMDKQGSHLHGDGTPTGQLEALKLLEVELENILEAMDSLLNRIVSSSLEPSSLNLEPALSLLLPIARWLWEFYDSKGKAKEQLELYSHMFNSLPVATEFELRFWVQSGLGASYKTLGMMDKASNLAETCLELVSSVMSGSTFDSGITRVLVDGTQITFTKAGVTALLRAIALQRLGCLRREQGRIDEAWECYKVSLAISRAVGDRHGEGESLSSIGALHLMHGRIEKARECIETSLFIRRDQGDRRGESDSLNNLGNLCYNQGQMDEAQEYYESSLVIARELGDRRTEGVSYKNLGILHHSQGRMEEAQECLETSLEISYELGDRSCEGSNLGNLGVINFSQGQMEKAWERYESSLAIMRELGDRRGEGMSLLYLGVLHSNQERMQKARECYETSLVIMRELGDRSNEEQCLNFLGCLHLDQGRLDEARKCFEASLAICQEVGDRRTEGNTLDLYAGLLLETGDLAKTRETLENSQHLCDELNLMENQAFLHAKWARYWLAVFEDHSGDTGFQHITEDDQQDISLTKNDIPATPQAALERTTHHLDIAKCYQAELKGTWETEVGQGITKARRAIIAFAEKHALTDQVADLIAENAAEDELRAQAEAKQAN